ncbi:MAG: FAD-dependent oxidoreductase [Omnitrophica bacterium RIFCSPHIGHO2_02_FULL_46_11]|nr:MAG: FAD-dependent oxidoreductase [Omnitrophica bacterium RIFCSPLOWO2_01_FULL_45_10b]OGW87396.1 MAG: FAD-dependent oxidoreductase [Omnitrophica bacterium RIFCSPHIGHO2_02_FULL_46_11]
MRSTGMFEECDYLVIGAGIIGLTVARKLNQRYPATQITLIEKEPDVALHSSGRNSGVLHAGFYYTADSLKAKLTRDGNAAMRKYCQQNGLRINECQKVVVTQTPEELPALFELQKRGKTNGVDVRMIDENELAEIDPNARTHQYALYSPTTATVDPIEVNQCLKNELIKKGVRIYFVESYLKRISGNKIQTSKRVIESKRLINTAGLYADRIARDFGYSQDYTIIPFKGIYLKYSREDKPVRTNIYPVPNLKNPFLGVHYTITVDGAIKIGPTAIPAFWRENYSGLERFDAREMVEIVAREAQLFLLNSFGFRDLAFEEIQKYNRSYFANLAARLVKSIDVKGFQEWTRPGIRAQLVNTRTLKLVMDFVVEGDELSTHILNAVSPAFTCSFPFAKMIVDRIVKA